MNDVNWIGALAGGALIGASATLLLLLNGRIAGISGIFSMATSTPRGHGWAWLFLAGMTGGGALYEYGWASVATPVGAFAPLTMLCGGLIAGFGARLGQGCTSGHGVCGLGRLSLRSLAAVMTFMATAIVTVWVIRHLIGGV
jgi:uncharacterized membrane protein YedE/YeeE